MPFALRFSGGPLDGETRMCDRLEDYGLSWPLPNTLAGSDAPEWLGGVYHKVSESALPPDAAEHPNVGVGAEFEWVVPCTCTLACIPQGITEEQTCRMQL